MRTRGAGLTGGVLRARRSRPFNYVIVGPPRPAAIPKPPSPSRERDGELAALRWTDVDLNAKVIRVRNDPPGTGPARRRTKNRRDRCVPIHPTLLTVLRQMPRQADGRVFHGPRGGRLKPDTVRTVFIRDVVKVLKPRFPSPPGETGFEKGRLHSFRHHFCSVAASGGVSQQLLKSWLGHRDSRMVDIYFHPLDAEGQRQMSRLEFTGDRVRDVAEREASEVPQEVPREASS